MMIRLPLEAIKEGKKTGRGKNVPINHNVKSVLGSQVRAFIGYCRHKTKMGWFMGNEPPRIEESVKG